MAHRNPQECSWPRSITLGPDRNKQQLPLRAAPVPKFRRVPARDDSEPFVYHRTNATFVLLGPLFATCRQEVRLKGSDGSGCKSLKL
jgi:hypothetical protein